jgi:hypothetical protein
MESEGSDEIEDLIWKICRLHETTEIFDKLRFQVLQRKINFSENEKLMQNFKDIVGSKESFRDLSESDIKMLMVQLYAFLNVTTTMKYNFVK